MIDWLTDWLINIFINKWVHQCSNSLLHHNNSCNYHVASPPRLTVGPHRELEASVLINTRTPINAMDSNKRRYSKAHVLIRSFTVPPTTLVQSSLSAGKDCQKHLRHMSSFYRWGELAKRVCLIYGSSVCVCVSMSCWQAWRQHVHIQHESSNSTNVHKHNVCFHALL